MDKLTSDSAQAEISARVKYMLRALFTNDWKSVLKTMHYNLVLQTH